MLSKLQRVIRGGEMLHTSWDHANIAFGMFWLDQALWYPGPLGRKVGGGEGTKLPLHLHNFPSSLCVPMCHLLHQGHWLPAASGCLLHLQPSRSSTYS